jgi:hypothetical protein
MPGRGGRGGRADPFRRHGGKVDRCRRLTRHMGGRVGGPLEPAAIFAPPMRRRVTHRPQR